MICKLDNDKYIKRLTHLYADKPNIIGIINNFANVVNENMMDLVCVFNTFLDIEKANGIYLDYLGSRAGFSRPIIPASGDGYIFDQEPFDSQPFDSNQAGTPFSDVNYRYFLKLHCLKLFSVSNYKDTKTIMDAVFGVGLWSVKDNGDMSISYTVRGNVDFADFLNAYDVLPRPSGVATGVVAKSPDNHFIIDKNPLDILPLI